MGKTLTPTYAVEFFEVRTAAEGAVGWTPMGWNAKQAGRPTAENLATFIKGYEMSTLPTGCNRHLGATTIGSAHIIRNDGSKEVIASYASPETIVRQTTAAATASAIAEGWTMNPVPKQQR